MQLAMPPDSEARAREFYCNVPELPERPKPPELAARGGCWSEGESVRIHLGISATHPVGQELTVILGN